MCDQLAHSLFSALKTVLLGAVTEDRQRRVVVMGKSTRNKGENILCIFVMRVVEHTCLLRTSFNQQLAEAREDIQREGGKEILSQLGDGACQTANGPGMATAVLSV